MHYIISIVGLFFQVYIILIVVRALISWIPHNPFNPVITFITDVTEPVLAPIRKGLPPNSLGLDASPIIAIIFLWLLWQLLLWLLYSI